MMKLHLATRHTQSLKKFNRVLKMKAIIFQKKGKKEESFKLIKVCTSNWRSYVSFQIRFVFLKFRTKDFLNM